MAFVNFSNFSHIFCAHISESKGGFNVKYSTYNLPMKTEILVQFQICISVPLRFVIFYVYIFSMSYFRIQIFQPATTLRETIYLFFFLFLEETNVINNKKTAVAL